MRVVEFIGPSGAGKTFLYHRLFSGPGRDRKYLDFREAAIIAASKLKISDKFPLISAMQRLLNLNLTKWKRTGLANKILQAAAIKDHSLVAAGSFSTSFNILMNCMLSEKDPRVVHKRLSNFIACMDQYSLLEKHVADDYLVVFDEGLLHHHHGLHPALLNKYTKEQLNCDTALNPLAVISCELPANEVFDRALQRRRNGVNTYSHRSLTERQLQDYVRRNVEEYQYKRDFLEMTGVPVLKINTAKSPQENVTKIASFINSL